MLGQLGQSFRMLLKQLIVGIVMILIDFSLACAKLATNLALVSQLSDELDRNSSTRVRHIDRYSRWILNGATIWKVNPKYEYYDELVPGWKFRNTQGGLWWEYYAAHTGGWQQIPSGDVVFTLMAYRDNEISLERARHNVLTILMPTPTSRTVRQHPNEWRRYRDEEQKARSRLAPRW